jgi:tetratricopeptide (TPR) repeat protein
VQARAYLQLGELEPAAAALEAVLERQPGNVVAHYNLGLTLYRARRYDEAALHLEETIRLKPDLPEAYYTLGLNALARGRTEAAIASLEKAVALNPKHVGARFNLASAYARAGRLQEAAREQTAFAGLSGRSKAEKERTTQITTSSVRAIRLIQEQKYEEALAAYQELAREFPDHAPLHSEIGGLQIRLNRPQEAAGSLRKAIEIDPRLSTPHYLLAGIHRQAGDAAAADRELEIFATLETIPEGKSGY